MSNLPSWRPRGAAVDKSGFATAQFLRWLDEIRRQADTGAAGVEDLALRTPVAVVFSPVSDFSAVSVVTPQGGGFGSVDVPCAPVDHVSQPV